MFRPAFIRPNLVTALSRFREQCSLEDLELKCLEIHNCIATRNWYHISLIWQFFFRQGRRLLMIQLISAVAPNVGYNRWPRQRWSCYSLSIFSPAVPSTTPTHGHFALSSVSLASRDQDGGPSTDSTIDSHLRSHGKIGDCEQSRPKIWISLIYTNETLYKSFDDMHNSTGIIEGLRAERACVGFCADFHFLQDRANFWQTDLFCMVP